jgi:hypothetical protein
MPTSTISIISGLREMIASGRLTEVMIPDDFQWLVAALDDAEPDPFNRRVDGIIAARVGETVSVEEIASALGIARDHTTLHGALDELVRAGDVKRAGYDSYIAVFKASGAAR